MIQGALIAAAAIVAGWAIWPRTIEVQTTSLLATYHSQQYKAGELIARPDASDVNAATASAQAGA